ncbi:MAG: potassium channel family protein [Methanobacterium sp.]
MYVIILGARKVGLSLASFLFSDRHDVTLIERDNNLCVNFIHNLNLFIITENGTYKVLEEAGIFDEEVFVAATENDETNLLSCVQVDEYNVPKTFARVSDLSHEGVFKKEWIDSVINPELIAASNLEKLIISSKITDLIIIDNGNAELLDIFVMNSKLFCKRTSGLRLTKDYILNTIHENCTIIIPYDTTKLKEDCRVSIIVKMHAVN